MKHLFIINPAAGSKDHTAEYTEKISKACSARELDYEIYISQGPGDCTRRTKQAGESGEETRVYACGGDGTLNEVVTGAVGYANLAVTVYSGGSGNDFVKVFTDPKAFFDLEQLLDSKEAEFDLIRCNEDYSLNICSVGLDARIGTDVGLYKRFPMLQGFRAYAVSTVVNVLKGISEHYVVEIDGERIDGEQTMICVCNGSYYGGGFHPVPEADPTDGLLDVLIVKKVSRVQVPGVVGKYKDGKYKTLPELVRYYRTKRVKVIADQPTAASLDGELRMAQEFDMYIADEKIRFFYPASVSIAVHSEPEKG